MLLQSEQKTYLGCFFRPILRYAGCLILFCICSVALTYERDSHYYLRYGLALSTCFNWHEAHLIASGDWGMDENRTTRAEITPLRRKNKIQWHAFGHSDTRFNELWDRSRTEEDIELRLIKLGQFMHFLEDWESHAGYGIRMGHARDTFRGRDPDSLGRDELKNFRMVQSSLDHLLRTCEDLGRLDRNPDLELVTLMTQIYHEQVLQDLFNQSDPKWKKGKVGRSRKRKFVGRNLSANKSRIEQLIERDFKPMPEKNVPEHFQAGDPDLGLPPPLMIRYDKEGEIVTLLPSGTSPDGPLGSQKPAGLADIDLDLINSRRLKKGWRVSVEVINQGTAPAPGSWVDVVVVKSDDETVLGEASRPLPELKARERIVLDFTVPYETRPPTDVIFGAYARTNDLSAENNGDWLMSEEVAEEAPEAPLITDVDQIGPAQGPEAIHLLSTPKIFLLDDAGCIVLSAYTSRGESIKKLKEVSLELLGDDGGPLGILRDIRRVWSALATQQQIVGGKTFGCFLPTPEDCAKWEAQQPESVSVNIILEADGSDRLATTVPLEPTILKGMARVCERGEEP